MKKVFIILVVFLCIVGIVVIALLCQMDNIIIRQTKDYAEIYIDEGDTVDYLVIINPPDKYSQLLQIDMETREELAQYMKENNYKIKSGKHEFIRNNPTLNELISDGFLFETK